jgi:hypothetical protein
MPSNIAIHDSTTGLQVDTAWNLDTAISMVNEGYVARVVSLEDSYRTVADAQTYLDDERARYVDCWTQTADEPEDDNEPFDDGEPPHVGHRSQLSGAWYCDTCDSPYCELA